MPRFLVDYDVSPDGQPVGGVPQNMTVDLPERNVKAAADAVAAHLGIPASHVVIWMVEEVAS